MAPTRNDLPEDIEACHALIAKRDERLVVVEHELSERDAHLSLAEQELSKRDQLIEKLQHQLKGLLRNCYGRRSEKSDPAQQLLFDDILEKLWDTPPVECESEEGEEEAPAKKPRRRGRKRFPASLPRKRIEHDIPEEEKPCPECGKPRQRIGEDISEQLEFVPGHFEVLQHARLKYACRECEGHIKVADKPLQPIEKGVPGPGLLAQIITAKYCDHLPLRRQEEIYARSGVDLARQTMWGWVRTLLLEAEPLYEMMKDLVLSSHKIHTDDTPVKLRDSRSGEKCESRIWVYVGDRKHPYTVFDYTPNRRRDGPVAFLGDWEGYLQADAYSGYDCIYASKKVTEVGCMAHTRRKFDDAQETSKEVCPEAMAQIGRLYRLEQGWKELDDESRKTKRQAQSVPLLEKFKQWLDAARLRVLPKSPAGQAIKYALKNWKALCRYTEHGELDIDNNAAERALRGIAVGRKNWLFFGSHKGGQAAAMFFSIIASCKRHGVDPFEYLRDFFARFPAYPDAKRADFLPDRWKQLRQKQAVEVSDEN